MRTLISNPAANPVYNSKVEVEGYAESIRKFGGLNFIIVRERTGYCQVIAKKELCDGLTTESVIKVFGTVKNAPQSQYNKLEIEAEQIEIVSKAESLPFNFHKEEIPLPTKMDWRPLTLRGEKERLIFKLQSEFLHRVREFLNEHNFVELQSPKLSASGIEGGSEVFTVPYFDTELYLTQSPQFYKQMGVSMFERVYEIGKVYRAEGSDSNRHLTEFTGIDFEMGFINSVEEIMEMEYRMLYHSIEFLHRKYNSQIEKVFGKVRNPFSHNRIPKITYLEAIEVLQSKYNMTITSEGLNAEMERMIGEHIFHTHGSDFVFITKCPLSMRPFYAMPSEELPGYSETFELLFKGIEITSGGQRIHNYNQLKGMIQKKGLNPENFESYLIPFKYGMPPHGGMGIGVERIMKQWLNLSNVTECSLIPRTKTFYKH